MKDCSLPSRCSRWTSTANSFSQRRSFVTANRQSPRAGDNHSRDVPYSHASFLVQRVSQISSNRYSRRDISMALITSNTFRKLRLKFILGPVKLTRGWVGERYDKALLVIGMRKSVFVTGLNFHVGCFVRCRGWSSRPRRVVHKRITALLSSSWHSETARILL